MRIGFVTAVRLGLSCMEAIYEIGGRLCFASTLRDDIGRSKSGRVSLDAFCERQNIPLSKIRNVNDVESVQAIKAADLDWLFIVGWSQIARAEVLRTPRKGVLGIHPTLLPIGRGRAPIPWAILLGLAETGVTLFKLDSGIDTGPILAQKSIPLDPRETATALYNKVTEAHLTVLKDTWPAIMADRAALEPQDDTRATTWAARTPADGELRTDMSVWEAERLIRAITHPYPGAFLVVPEGILRVWASGAPSQDLDGGEQERGTTRRLHFAGGWIDATDWELESHRPR